MGMKQLQDWSVSLANPLNWNRPRKWMITLTSCYMSSLISIAASAYSIGTDQMITDLHSSRLLVISGISFFTLAIAIFPLFLSPLGEEVGRRYVYLVSYAIFFIFFLPIALARNIQTVLISRFITGAAGSVGATMVGGTLSDIWEREERGLPMALFSLSALFGTPIGPIFFSWTGRSASWRWIDWVMLIAFAPSAVLVLIVFRAETLPSVIRRRKGYDPPKDTSGSVLQRARQVLSISAIRPLVFLCTEPITTALSVWISFAWGVLYLFLESIPLVFEPYGFIAAKNTQGLAFTGLAIGSITGFLLSVAWDKQRKGAAVGAPEKRLGQAFVGGVLFAAGFFWYAWSAQPGRIHWIVPQIGTSILMTGLFLFYVCIFNYFADCYGSYTSSAIAAQSFSRNITATTFPLFARQMYQSLGYPWASSLLGFLAAVLALVPLLLIKYGATLRARSPFASGRSTLESPL